MSLDISLKHIAEAAGVSRTTVSLALRNHPRISKSTRERVQKLAKEMGYRPNAEVSRVLGKLREKREDFDRPVLALISDYEVPIHRQKPESRTWRGFHDRCMELGYTPEEFWMGDGRIGPDRLVTILETRGIRGLVFTGLRDPGLAGAMDLSSFACATIGNSIHQPELNRATSDKYHNTQLCCERLWERGARRIGLAVPALQEHRVEHTFLSGYLVFHRLHKHKEWQTPFVDDDPWEPERIIAWIRLKKLDACVVAYPGLESRVDGVRIAGVNVMEPGQCGINQRHDRIASGAVDLVDAQLRRNQFGLPPYPKAMLVRGEWIEE
jgi:LacI family transcriptional regulator